MCGGLVLELLIKRFERLRKESIMKINRRLFLSGIAASATVPLFAKQPSEFDENLMVFFADTHIAGVVSSGYQSNELIRAVANVLSLRPLPRNVCVFGDFAHLSGFKADYEAAAKIIAPLSDAGIKVTIALGNHDRRSPFLELYPDYAKTTKVPGRIVSTVTTPHADLILLDSCQEGPVEGKLNDEQKEWLSSTLKNYAKPVFVGSHHPLNELGIAKDLVSSPMVAGYIHGHNHRWLKTWRKRNWRDTFTLRQLCLPSTGHWGDIGYTLFRIQPDRAIAELCQHDFFFPKPASRPEEAPPEWAIYVEENKGQQCTFLLPRQS